MHRNILLDIFKITWVKHHFVNVNIGILNKTFCSAKGLLQLKIKYSLNYFKNLDNTTVSEGLLMKCLAIFLRQENVNQKNETHPVKFYFTKQLLFIF